MKDLIIDRLNVQLSFYKDRLNELGDPCQHKTELIHFFEGQIDVIERMIKWLGALPPEEGYTVWHNGKQVPHCPYWEEEFSKLEKNFVDVMDEKADLEEKLQSIKDTVKILQEAFQKVFGGVFSD